MSWKYYNPNPRSNLVGDCVVRALSLALNQDWDDTYLGVTEKGYELKDMPSSNAIWSSYLKAQGFKAYNSYRDYSGARGRDAMGRYTSRDGMPSGNSQYDKEDMINNLRMKARNARSEEERANYLNMADRLSM